MSAITLSSLSYHLPQETPAIFPSAAQEAEFLRLIGNMGLSLKKEAFTPMHIAAALGDVAECKRLMALGGDPNEVGECGFPPFFMFATIYLKKQQESEHPDLDTAREMANLLFDALYAKGGFSNPQAQCRAWDQALHIEANAPNSLESIFYWEEGRVPKGCEVLLLLSGMIASSDEQMALNLLETVRFKEEMALLLLPIMKIWTENALTRFMPKMTIQGQTVLLNNVLRLANREELFCQLWDTVLPETKKANDWMHEAMAIGSNKIIAYFLKNNAYNVQSTNRNGITVLYCATVCKQLIDPQLYQEIATRDAGYTQAMFAARVFGHRFSLKGPHFEGATREESQNFISILANSIEQWSFTFQSPYQETLCKKIATICETLLLATQDVSSEELYWKSTSGSILIISGPANHTVNFIINRAQLVKINTQSPRAMRLYDIHDYHRKTLIKIIEWMKVETLQKELREAKKVIKCREEQSDLLSKVLFKQGWKSIKNLLGLQLSNCDFHMQTSGNCTWEAHKAAVFALLFFEVSREATQEAMFAPPMKRLDSKSPYIQELVAPYFAFRSSWPSFDAAQGFREALPTLSQLGFDLRRDIFPKVVLHCLQRSTLYHAKIEQPIIDILNLDPTMSAKTFKNKKDEELSLLEYAEEAKLNHVRAYLKILSRVNGPLPITYTGDS